jgi:hypothetical protein
VEEVERWASWSPLEPSLLLEVDGREEDGGWVSEAGRWTCEMREEMEDEL